MITNHDAVAAVDLLAKLNELAPAEAADLAACLPKLAALPLGSSSFAYWLEQVASAIQNAKPRMDIHWPDALEEAA